MIINTECGGFSGFVMGDFDKTAIANTEDPTRQLFEKMSSGKYLSGIIYQALCTAYAEGMLQGPLHIEPFALKDVSEFLTKGEFCCEFTQSEKDFFAEMCIELIRRAAKMGAIANAALAIASCTDKSLPVAIVAEGTTFHKLPYYRQFFEEYLTQILGEHGISYKILQGQDLNLVGTLMATMVLD